MTQPVDAFAERLLQVIDEGRRTATYKLALLLALIDACGAESDEHGRAPAELHTRIVAKHVLKIYFPQVRSYLGTDGDELALRQITMKSSAVLGKVLRLHLLAVERNVSGLLAIEQQLPDDFERCVDEVERTFARYPLRLLQVVGRDERPFLYDVDWGESVSLRALHAVGGGAIRFWDGAADQLLRLAPLLRPLIELHWTRMVARINRINTEDDRLHAHLFGSERVTFPRSLRIGLGELQEERCFYCNQRLTSRTQVDHFIPWTRWPNNAVENLVLADTCNSYKSDYLAAMVHTDRWATRLDLQRGELADLARSARWETDATRSLALARTSYAHLPAGTPLWLGPDSFTEDDPVDIATRLADIVRSDEGAIE